MKQVMCTRVGSLRETDSEKRGKVSVMEVPIPEMGNEYVKIKVAYCAICGSDPHLVEGVFGLEPPFGLGHEVSGIVVEVGKTAAEKGIKVGDRVGGNFIHFCGSCYYCRNGQEQFCEAEEKPACMSEYIVWHYSQICKLPDTISLKKGCLLEPTSIIVRILDKANMKAGQRVAISGGGPIGLLTLQAFKMFGATDLTLIEPVKERLELAKKFGADHIINPIDENVEKAAADITCGRGFDVVIEASGATSAAPTAVKIAAKCATVMYVAMYPLKYEMPLNLQQYGFSSELTITAMNVAPYAYPRAVNLLNRMSLDEFTTKVYSIDNAAEAFDMQMTGKYPKILLCCNDDLKDL